MTIYLLDDLGNFLVDDLGNRLTVITVLHDDRIVGLATAEW